MALRDVDRPAEQEGPNEQAQEAQPHKQPSAAPTVAAKPERRANSRGWKALSVVLVLLLLAAAAGIAYQAQTNAALVAEIDTLQQSLAESQDEVQGFELQIRRVHEGLLSVSAQLGELTALTGSDADIASDVLSGEAEIANSEEPPVADVVVLEEEIPVFSADVGEVDVDAALAPAEEAFEGSASEDLMERLRELASDGIEAIGDEVPPVSSAGPGESAVDAIERLPRFE